MNRGERCMRILNILQEKHVVQVSQLAREFNISEMTARRDLNLLSQQYNITRTHGGATLNKESVVRVISFDESRILNLEAKEKIAEKAASFVRDGQRIFVDAGSTTRIMINYLADITNAVIVTNHLKTAEKVLELHSLHAIMLGGELLSETGCSYGDTAEEQLKKYPLDIAFIGAASIGADGYLYDGFSPEAQLKRTLFSAARKIYLLADSSKYNKYELHSFARLSQLDGAIVDTGIDEEGRALLKKHNVKMILADTPDNN